jgi:hypothetical protein
VGRNAARESLTVTARLELTMKSQVPRQFADDPLAATTQWSPLNKGGITFRTRWIQQLNRDRVEFVPTVLMRLFPYFALGFAIAGYMLAVFFFRQFAEGRTPMEMIEQGNIMPLIVLAGVPFSILPVVVIVGVYWWIGRRPIVFDRDAGFTMGNAKTAVSIPFKQIAGIQIICEVVKSETSEGNTTTFPSFELNLVLRDASRKNVVDHGHLKTLREDAAKLGEFLGVPVWDATQA